MVTMTFSEAIRDVLPSIKSRRAEIEQARKLPQDLVDQLAATGVFRLGMPRVLGGFEADPLDQMRAIEMISAADGSTGWCAMLGIGVGMTSGYLSEAGAREIFADPSRNKALVAEPAGAAVREADGFRVSGRWRFASGCTAADWVVLGFVVMRDGQPNMTPHGPEIIHAFLPVSDITIHDTWHVSGLCGTGSNDVSCQDVFVPADHTCSLFFPDGFYKEPLWRISPLPIVAPHTAIVAVGVARAALDELAEMAVSKTPAMSQARLSEKPMFQAELARLEAALGGARSFMYEALDDLWQTVASGQEPTLRQRALVRAASNQATETAARVARAASTLAGGNAVYNTSDLQRHARDADVITHHFTQAVHVWEDAGRALMGIPPQAPVF